MSCIKYIVTSVVAIMLLACSCSGKEAKNNDEHTPNDQYTEMGAFSADSAYSFIKQQVAFGPRVPGSEAHSLCSDWFIEKLNEFGADTVIILKSQATAWDGARLPIKNIFARFNTKAKDRIILTAHYDTRPWADNDPDPSNRNTAIDGANDGASGVAVILEIARNLGEKTPEIGVDILLNDCEDYGVRQDVDTDITDSESTWCLGTQAFVEDLPYSITEIPRFGILLDMVGGENARFNPEYFSSHLAEAPTAKVWAIAHKLGLAEQFPSKIGNPITDDHLPLIRAGIPTTNIIENCNPQSGVFPPTWHTVNDNITHIDPSSLDAVGRVVLNVIYNEKL